MLLSNSGAQKFQNELAFCLFAITYNVRAYALLYDESLRAFFY